MIIHADLRDIPDDIVASCDAMITDPPYSDYVHDHVMSSQSAGVGPVARLLGFGPLTDALRDHLARCAALVRRWSVVCSDVESTHLWRASMAAAGVEYVREVPCIFGDEYGTERYGAERLPTRWIRWSQPQISGDRPPTGCEAILHFHAVSPAGPRGAAPKPIAKRWNGPGGLTHYGSRSLRGADKHPTEKPLDLGLTLVACYTDPGDTVYLPCEGRGTFAQACRLLGRECVGVEGDSVWAAEAELRTTEPYDRRDRAAAEAWATRWAAEASTALETNTDPRCQPSRDRAQRRLDDARRVEEELSR